DICRLAEVNGEECSGDERHVVEEKGAAPEDSLSAASLLPPWAESAAILIRALAFCACCLLAVNFGGLFQLIRCTTITTIITTIILKAQSREGVSEDSAKKK